MDAPLSLQTASIEELLRLPILPELTKGAQLMEAIVAYRKESPFERISDLLQVPGIGPTTYEKLWPFFVLFSEEQELKERFTHWYGNPRYWTQQLQFTALSMTGRGLEPPLSQELLGGPYSFRQRFQLQSTHLSAHLSLDKDPWEKGPAVSQALQYPNTVHLGIHDVLLKKSTVGPRSGSLRRSKGRLRGSSVIQNFGKSRGSSLIQSYENFPNSKQGLRIESLIIGNLRLQTGLGLVIPSSGYSGAQISSGRMHSLTQLRANQGFSEASGLFGVSAHLRWGGAGQTPSQWALLLVNAKLHELGIGYERTKQEVQKATQLGKYPIKGVRAVYSTRPSNLLPWILGIEAYRTQKRTQNEDLTQNQHKNQIQNENQNQNEWSWGLDVQTKHRPWYLAMGLSPTSAVFRVNDEPDWSPVHVQLKSFYKKDQSGILLAEMPSFGSDWGLFSGTKAEQGWEIAAQYHPSPTLNMYSAVGSSKEPKASGYDRFPEQRSYWAVQLHYESLAIPLRMQFDIRRKIQQNTWRANAQIGYEFSPGLRLRARLYWTQANTQ